MGLKPTSNPRLRVDPHVLHKDERCTIKQNASDPEGFLGKYLTNPRPQDAHRVPTVWREGALALMKRELLAAYHDANSSKPKGKIVFATCLLKGTREGEVRAVAMPLNAVRDYVSERTREALAASFGGLLDPSLEWELHPCILSGPTIPDFPKLLEKVVGMVEATVRRRSTTAKQPAHNALGVAGQVSRPAPAKPTTKTVKEVVVADPELGEFLPEGQMVILEGKLVTRNLTTRGRSREARAACVRIHGCQCSVCGIDFGQVYGNRGDGFCHVHHMDPIHATESERPVDPATDLAPVCPNCHAMLHTENPPLDIDDLKREIRGRGWRWAKRR